MAFRALSSLIPNADDLLALDMPTLGKILLSHLKSYEGSNTVFQNGLLNRGYFVAMLEGRNVGLGPLPQKQPEYGPKQPEVIRAALKAWNWLEREGILIRDPDQPVPWFRISRRGEDLLSEGDPSGAFIRDGKGLADNPATDRKFARLAIDEARKSVSESDGRAHPKVGAVVVKDGRVLSTAHRGEQSGNHAEFVALEKKLSDEAIAGATVYTTLEPCTTRNHPKIPCVERLIERKVARVVIGMLDPDDRISGKGVRKLRKAGIETVLFPHDLGMEVEELNREFTRFCEQSLRTEVGPASMELWKEVAGIRSEFGEFRQNAETRERERAEFENFPASFAFDQGSPGNYSGSFKNDSKYKVSVETIQILRGDVDYESPLTEAVKPRPTEDWIIEPGQSKTLSWGPQHDPINMLRSLVQSSDPNFPQGKVRPILVSLTFTAGGRRLTKKFVRQVLIQGNQILSWGL